MTYKKTNSCINIFSISNRQYRRCNRFADRVYRRNKAALVVLIFLAVFRFFPYQIQAILLSKVENNLNNTDIKTENYFDFFTTEISSTATNMFEDDVISTTMIYTASNLSLLPKINTQNQDNDISDLVNNNIMVSEEGNTEFNTIENLEQSIRNSVKSEIKTEKHSEPSQVMEILKQLTDPEIRLTLSADIISLDNSNNQNSFTSSTEQNMLLKKHSILESERNIELLPLPKTEETSGPEFYNVHETNETKAIRRENIDHTKESTNDLPNYLINKHEVNIVDSIAEDSTETTYKDQHKSNNFEQLRNDTGIPKKIPSEEISAFPKLEEITKPLVVNSNIKTKTDRIFDEFYENHSSNEILSVTFNEPISDISVNTKGENISDVNEYKLSIEQQLIKKNEKNNTEGENLEHLVIKKVLSAQENSDSMSETTSRAYPEKELISSDKISNSYFNLDQVLNNDDVNSHSSYDRSIKYLLKSSKVLRQEYQMSKENYDQNDIVQPLTNSNMTKIKQNNYLEPKKHKVLASLSNQDMNHIPLKKTDIDVPFNQININSNANSSFSSYSKVGEPFIQNNDTKYNWEYTSNNRIIKYSQYLDSENLNNTVNIKNVQKEKAKDIQTANTEFFSSITYKSNINYTDQNMNTMLLQQSESKSLDVNSKEYISQTEPHNKLHISFPNSSFSGQNKKEVLNTVKGYSSADIKDFKTKFDDAVASLFEGYPPQDAGQTLNDNLADEITGIGKALPVSITDKFNRSAIIIILSSVTACLFVIASVTIFLVSFQRQNGTLNIEMQERSCGKDDLDEEDAQTFTKLLEVEFSHSVAIALDETEECL